MGKIDLPFSNQNRIVEFGSSIAERVEEQLTLPLWGAEKKESIDGKSSTPAIDTYFPIKEANELAHIESYNKHLFRPNTYLHKWWARRSGSTFRHILKQLVTKPDLCDYYMPDGLSGQVILDPMMGGGTTLHEAVRLGARVIGFDLDPIPVLQAKASLTEIPLHEKRVIFDRFFSVLSNRLAGFFTTSCPHCMKSAEIRFTLWALRKKCKCGTFFFVDSLRLREEPNGNVIMLSARNGEPYVAESEEAALRESDPVIFEKTVHTCPWCESNFQELQDISFRNRYSPVVVVGVCKEHGQFFKKPASTELEGISRAADERTNFALPKSDEVAVVPGPKSNDLIKRNIHSFKDVFSDRQLIYLSLCKELLESVEEKHRVWLGMLVSTSLEFSSLLCGYKGSDKRRPGAIRHVFSHHAYSFPTTALEGNPVFSGNSSGTLSLLFRDRIETASEWAQAPIERRLSGGIWKKVVVTGETDRATPVTSFAELCEKKKAFWAKQQNSITMPIPDEAVDHVVTDPPYFDSVQYSDLANFFRVWLHWLLPTHANWNYDVQASAVAETERDGKKYETVLTGIWSECHRVLKKRSGRLIFTFHHWHPEAWARLTSSLKKTGFRLVTAYTIHSENPISVHIRQLNALKHDSVLVLRPVTGNEPIESIWPLPLIKADDSATFCTGCAELLGYCLESKVTEQEILALWNRALKG
jgi:putative DNA methylase